MPADRIDPLAPIPLYRQIAAILKRRILSGQYPPNTRILTESELIETYEVARTTARRAVGALRDEGLSTPFHSEAYTLRRSRATAPSKPLSVKGSGAVKGSHVA